MKKKMMVLGLVIMAIFTLSGCGFFESKKNELKGSLKGVTYNVDFYDNYGVKNLTLKGENINITGNKIKREVMTLKGIV